jgi:hypothetical protein
MGIHHDHAWTRMAPLGAVLLAVTAVGCSRDQGPPRVVVCGAVTYQGKPVAQGQIRFVPTKGSTGPVSIASIVDGRYRADAKGGLPVATQRVEILAYRLDPKHNRQDPPPPGIGTSSEWPPKEQYLPTKYNTQSILELVVDADRGEIHKDFELAD